MPGHRLRHVAPHSHQLLHMRRIEGRDFDQLLADPEKFAMFFVEILQGHHGLLPSLIAGRGWLLVGRQDFVKLSPNSPNRHCDAITVDRRPISLECLCVQP
jgi:hypothetical protein